MMMNIKLLNHGTFIYKMGSHSFFFSSWTADVRQVTLRDSIEIKYNPVTEAFVWNSRIKKET